jgi:hypothetical protein
VEESEFIIVGEVTRVDETGDVSVVENGRTWPLIEMSASVLVRETLKGEDVPKSMRLEFLENRDAQGDGPQPARIDAGYRILFLKRDDGSYHFADDALGAIRVAAHCSAPDSLPALDAYARVAKRAACALFSGDATAQEKQDALSTLSADETPVTREIYIAALAGDGAKHDAPLRQNLIASLLRANYTPAIEMAERELFSDSAEPDINARINLLLGLQFVSPARSVPILARALALPESQLRQAAARAMQNTHSAEAINPLLRALNDPDREVQFTIMQSLGFLNNELDWRPHTTAPDSFWDECMAHWQALARERLAK